MSEENDLIQEKINTIFSNAEKQKLGLPLKPLFRTIPFSDIKNKADIDTHFQGWLKDFSAFMTANKIIDKVIADEQRKENDKPCIFCCACGQKIYTDKTPVEYLQASNIDLILCGIC